MHSCQAFRIGFGTWSASPVNSRWKDNRRRPDTVCSRACAVASPLADKLCDLKTTWNAVILMWSYYVAGTVMRVSNIVQRNFVLHCIVFKEASVIINTDFFTKYEKNCWFDKYLELLLAHKMQHEITTYWLQYALRKHFMQRLSGTPGPCLAPQYEQPSRTCKGNTELCCTTSSLTGFPTNWDDSTSKL